MAKHEKPPVGVVATKLASPIPTPGVAASAPRLPEARPARPQTLWLEAGAPRLFNRADINGRGLVSGWGPPEERHTWSDGLTAVQQIGMMREPTGPMTLTVEGMPYVLPNHEMQEVTLYGNGFHLGLWRHNRRVLMTMTVQIEPEQWFIRRGLAHMRLMWILPNSVRPADVDDGPDSRSLAFAFGSIAIADAGED